MVSYRHSHKFGLSGKPCRICKTDNWNNCKKCYICYDCEWRAVE